MKEIIDKKEIKSFNLYYRQLCFVAIAIIWLFKGGYLDIKDIKDDGGWILYAFGLVILGLIFDFIIQFVRVFKCKLSNRIVKIIYLFFQFIVIVVAYFYIGKYLIEIYSQSKA